MIYHQITSQNPLEIYLNLEELLCLKNITNTECFIQPNDVAKKYFDFSHFQVVTELKKDALTMDIADYVCMYNFDFIDIEGSEFLEYKRNQEKKYLRLDKFELNDFHVRFSKPNYYETKYFHSNKNIYRNAIKQSSIFLFNKKFQEEYDFLKQITPKLPLLCLKESEVNSIPKLPITDCVHVADKYNYDFGKILKESQGINSLNLHDYIRDYHSSLKNVDINMLLLIISENFKDIYGYTQDYVFGALCKQMFLKDKDFKVNLLNVPDCGLLENFNFRIVDSNACFSFSKMKLNCHRSDLMSLIRFNECVID